MSQNNTREILSRYFPVEAVDHIGQVLTDYRIRLKVNRGRATRLGDFKPAVNGGLHRISVNGDLNIYAFLLVFIHELAHLQVHEEFRGKSDSMHRSAHIIPARIMPQSARIIPPRIMPHGKEWKRQFGELIRLYVEKGYFHPLLHESLLQYSHRVKASGIASEPVARALRLFDDHGEKDPFILLEELDDLGVFSSRSGRQFRKGAKLRKRYRCLCLDNQRTYLFHPMAAVRPVKEVNERKDRKRTAIFANLLKL